MEKLKNVKIVFTDIDGTLTNSKRQISAETSIAIKNAIERGIIVVLCSGRNNKYVENASKISNASNYIIACNGAEVFDYKNNIHINSTNINKKDAQIIWDYCKNNVLGCILNCKNLRYCNANYSIEEKDKVIINNLSEIDEDIFQIVAFGYNYEKMNNLEKIINPENLKIINMSHSYLEKDCSKHHFFFDITSKDVNKGNAIKFLLNYLNLSKENAVGFGDHINDYDLFNEVGFKVAMGNASEKLKELADYVTLSNDEHGVAYFLNNFIEYDKEDNYEKE